MVEQAQKDEARPWRLGCTAVLRFLSNASNHTTTGIRAHLKEAFENHISCNL